MDPSAAADLPARAAAGGRDPHYGKGVALVLIAGLFWSVTSITIRYIEEAGDWRIIFYRSGSLAVFYLLILAFRHRGATFGEFRRIGWNGIWASLFFCGAIVSIVFAVNATTIANAMFILGGGPFAVAGLAWLLMRERVRPATAIAMVVTLAGIGVMVGDGIGAGRLFGNFVAVLAMLSYAIYVVFVRRGRATNLMPALCLGAAMAAGLGAAFCDGFAISGVDLLFCVVSGAGLVGIGLLFFLAGSRYLSATELMLLALTEIALAPIWAWLVLGEVPRDLTLIGGGTIIAAIVGQAVLGQPRAALPAR
jgi:DME family drug/metabolite transporter